MKLTGKLFIRQDHSTIQLAILLPRPLVDIPTEIVVPVTVELDLAGSVDLDTFQPRDHKELRFVAVAALNGTQTHMTDSLNIAEVLEAIHNDDLDDLIIPTHDQENIR